VDPVSLALTVGGIVAVLGTSVTALVLASRPKTRPWTGNDRKLVALAERFDELTCDLGSFLQNPRVEGVIDGVSIKVALLDSSDLAGSVMELVVTAPGALSEGTVWPKTGDRPGAEAGARVKTGDVVFDEHVEVRSPHPAASMAYLDHHARALLADDPPWRLQFGQWTRRLPEVPDVDGLADLVQDALTLARTVRADRGLDGELEHLVDADPVPEVRVAALQAWLARGRPPRERLRQWAGGDDLRAVLAAEALGTEGAEALQRLLRSSAALPAALALSTHEGLERAVRLRAEAVLVAALVEPEGRLEVIDALGRIAGTSAVAALKLYTGGVVTARAGERAQAAIRAIQARAVGAEAGQVSIAATGAEGGLSVASEAAAKGRVSEVDR